MERGAADVVSFMFIIRNVNMRFLMYRKHKSCKLIMNRTPWKLVEGTEPSKLDLLSDAQQSRPELQGSEQRAGYLGCRSNTLKLPQRGSWSAYVRIPGCCAVLRTSH